MNFKVEDIIYEVLDTILLTHGYDIVGIKDRLNQKHNMEGLLDNLVMNNLSISKLCEIMEAK